MFETSKLQKFFFLYNNGLRIVIILKYEYAVSVGTHSYQYLYYYWSTTDLAYCTLQFRLLYWHA
jgi:hypothetical protein